MLVASRASFPNVDHHIHRMRPDDDHIEVVGFQIAGPSKSNVTSNRHRRRAIKPRRKAQPALSQDIIEISDSDDESSYEKPVPMTAGKGKARAVGEGTVASPDRRPRVPLFLPDGDNGAHTVAIRRGEDRNV